MSDQETNSAEESAAVAEAEAPAEQNAAATPPVAKKSNGVAWLALLLVLALAGGAVWVLRQAQDREAGHVERVASLVERVAGLEQIAGQEQASLDDLGSRFSGELISGLDSLKSTLAGETSQLGSQIDTIRADLASQQAELDRFSASDRDSWLMAEAQYLLRLANQRLIMAGDTKAAEALLGSADDVLRQLDDTRLHGSRRAVAEDLAAVRAVPRVDVEGIYLRLAALIDQADQLVIFQMQQQEAQPQPEAAEDWRGRLQQGYAAALAKLSDYIIIRRRDVPMQTLMDPQWEGLVRQNLRMLLEQAQVALLSGNQALYGESLGRAGHWVAQFSDSDAARAEAMSREIKQLGDQVIAVTLPDISGSLRALDAALEQQGGSE